MISILFIDDEKNILDGIRRILRPYRSEWNLIFCTTPDEVFSKLDSEAIDIIVSDMQMPQMHGVELLEKVRQLHPQVIRISLTGQVDEEMAARNAMVSHQQLFKPCEAEALISTINTLVELVELNQNERLTSVVSSIRALPSLPRAYQELIAELGLSESSLDKLSMIMANDIGMSSKILQLVNSAFFGLPRSIKRPDEAANFLGVDVIKGLALSIGIFSQLKDENSILAKVEGLHSEGLMLGQICADLETYDIFAKHDIESAQVAGMLLNIGKLIIMTRLPEEDAQIQDMIKLNGCSETEAEKSILSCTNYEVASNLLALWGLPECIVKAIHDFTTPHENECANINATTVLHIANALHQKSYHKVDPDEIIDEAYIQALGIESLVNEIVYQDVVEQQVVAGQ